MDGNNEAQVVRNLSVPKTFLYQVYQTHKEGIKRETSSIATDDSDNNNDNDEENEAVETEEEEFQHTAIN